MKVVIVEFLKIRYKRICDIFGNLEVFYLLYYEEEKVSFCYCCFLDGKYIKEDMVLRYFYFIVFYFLFFIDVLFFYVIILFIMFE